MAKHFNISIFASVLDRDSHGARRCVDREREREREGGMGGGALARARLKVTSAEGDHHLALGQ